MPDGLSNKAKQFFNMEKEEDSMVTKKTSEMIADMEGELPIVGANAPSVVEVDDAFEFLIDTPKSMWDALGHMSFKFTLHSYEEAESRVDQTLGFFAVIKDKYADLFEVADRATPAQLQLLAKLFGGTLPEGMDKLSKVDASAKIETEMKLQKQQPQVNTGGKYSYANKPTVQPQAPTPGAPTGSGPTEAQWRYVNTIAKKKGIQVPADLVTWNSKQASDWISQNK